LTIAGYTHTHIAGSFTGLLQRLIDDSRLQTNTYTCGSFTAPS